MGGGHRAGVSDGEQSMPTSLRAAARVTVGALLLAALVPGGAARAQTDSARHAGAKPYAPVGLFFGAIEEGARIFTPVRLLPLDHPEALHHDFPTVLQLHGTEFSLLLWLGRQVGFQLWPTLERYPTMPSTDWPYREFQQPPDSAALARAPVRRRASADAPLPGLRAAIFDGSALVAFIVDTRGIPLAARHMTRTTSMGLEVDRTEFLRALQSAAAAPGSGLSVALWSKR